MCLPFFRRKGDGDDYYANNYNTANNVNQGAAYIRLLGADHHFVGDWGQGGNSVGGEGGGGGMEAGAGCDSYGCDSGGGGDSGGRGCGGDRGGGGC
ncbi:hypothetical protein FBULB1_1069 [Fusarium bulbicola]|nr:hypothetical protein FBULB1_1069 [Fusarium bulbicola]